MRTNAASRSRKSPITSSNDRSAGSPVLNRQSRRSRSRVRSTNSQGCTNRTTGEDSDSSQGSRSQRGRRSTDDVMEAGMRRTGVAAGLP